jgi:glutamate synthase domain-containing protein 3
MTIDASGLHYRQLNERIRAAVADGETELTLTNVCGHRYIGSGIDQPVEIRLQGIPGNDLAAFMSGPRIRCSGNAQDGIGNTMDDGLVVVPGHAGDVMGYSMRGGCIYIRGNAGYRIGIHMKSYLDKAPVVIIGGRVRDFCGEYLAGGKLIVLGLDQPAGEPLVGKYCASGMHGGTMYVRGHVPPDRLRPGVSANELTAEDRPVLRDLLTPYCAEFALPLDELLAGPFVRIAPHTTRPYGQLYAY